MYIGSIVTVKEEHWVLPQTETKTYTAVRKEIDYNPGLFHIIREIVSNVLDNKWRSEKHGVTMKKIEIAINSSTGEISVLNDGYCIPVRQETYKYKDYRTGKTTEELLYPAQTFFGDLLSGTNFDDSSERKTSGLNGLGAKLTNIFSTRFTVEHTNPDDGKKFEQTYSNNAKEHTKPKITACRSKTGYTKITFIPDYERFKFQMNDDFINLLRLYFCEASMITGLPITVKITGDDESNEKLHFKTLPQFVKLFHPSTKNLLHYTTPTGDECVIVEAPEPDVDSANNISNISYVNGLRTKDGGVHVDAWRDALIPALVRAYNARKKKDNVKTSAKQLYPFLSLFVRVEIDKPAFDSQTKDRLNSPTPDVVKPSEADIAKMLKWGFVSIVEERLKFLADRQLQKLERAKPKVKPGKLTDANEAGGKNSLQCTLFITEGDSAKELAETLAAQLPGGSDYYGAFAIKGKFMNVAAASTESIANNDEIQQIQAAIGLVPRTDYSKPENLKTLRYGKVVFFTDADDDGFHIRGLLANFFWVRYRSLWTCEGFQLSSESTPVVKVWDKPSLKVASRVFYTNVEYKAWAEKNATGKERIEYLKGLASIKEDDVDEIAENRKTVDFYLEGDEEEYMSMAFEKTEADSRKQWIIRDMDDNVYVEPKFAYEGPVSLSTFMDTNFLTYMQCSVVRAIPSVIDGFKESQRKMLFGIIASGYTSLAKHDDIERIAGNAGAASGYHHGGASAQETIMHMTQGFVGANNIPLLVNKGQTGSRRGGGKIHGAPRYAKTYTESIVNVLFNTSDAPILKYLDDNGHAVEPQYYAPIIPMFLVNGKAKAHGSDGIATGFSTSVPSHNPLDLVSWIESWLDDNHEDHAKLVPWWRGFNGRVTLNEDNTAVTVRGIMEKVTTGKFKGWYHITELPPGLWINNFKEMVVELMSKQVKTTGKKKVESPAVIKDFKEYNKSNSVDMYILPIGTFIPSIDEPGNPFNIMEQTISLRNIVGLDRNGHPRFYKTAEEVLEYYCPIRLEIYSDRKKWLISSLEDAYKRAINKNKFIKAVQNGDLDMNQDDDDLNDAMEGLGLDKMSSSEGAEPSYDYLLSLQMRTIMSKSKCEELEQQATKIESELKTVKKTSERDMWRADLNDFKKAYPKWVSNRCEEVATKRRNKPT